MSTLAMASSSFKLASVTAPHGHYSRQCHRITIPSTASDSPQQQPDMPRRNILFNKCEMGKLLGPPRRCGSFMTCSSEAIMTGARDHVQWWMTDPKAQVQGVLCREAFIPEREPPAVATVDVDVVPYA